KARNGSSRADPHRADRGQRGQPARWSVAPQADRLNAALLSCDLKKSHSPHPYYFLLLIFLDRCTSPKFWGCHTFSRECGCTNDRVGSYEQSHARYFMVDEHLVAHLCRDSAGHQ